MALGLITLLSALTISAIAIYYSVAGLAAIFAAAVVPIIVMDDVVEPKYGTQNFESFRWSLRLILLQNVQKP